jgi:hypothetical protein
MAALEQPAEEEYLIFRVASIFLDIANILPRCLEIAPLLPRPTPIAPQQSQ